ncbi:MAG: family 20 glycosylhydrolase, partial [Syntrophothermus sp.]
MSYRFSLRPLISLTVILIAVVFLQSCRTIAPPEQVKRLSDAEEIRLDKIIPKPVSAVSAPGVFQISPSSAIYTDISNGEQSSIGRYLSERLTPAAGYIVRVNNVKSALPSKGNIFLLLSSDSLLGEEGYQLNISADSLVLTAFRPAGLFRGVQSIRQLLPSDIEANNISQGPLTIACGVIRDYPRFPWRGVMLDVCRHFFKPEDVKRYIDLVSLYKMNRFHLHLGDDQGWRLEIKSWPNLTLIGGSTQVDGGKGGYYTQEEFKDIINYAAARYITVVPEFDMPGHTNAALASYPELNENGIAPQLYTGTKVGFSTLSIGKEVTYKFAEDLVREVS